MYAGRWPQKRSLPVMNQLRVHEVRSIRTMVRAMSRREMPPDSTFAALEFPIAAVEALALLPALCRTSDGILKSIISD